MLANLGLVAAGATIVWAFIAGCRQSGRLRWSMLAAIVLLAINLTLSWQAEDPPGSVLVGMTAVIGLVFAAGLFAAALVAGALGRLIRRLG